MRLLPLLLFLIVAVVVLLPLLRGIRLPVQAARRPVPDELVKDPVCQTYIVKSRAIRRAGAGHIRYFCSERCARLDTGV
jgi:hypothetical protein